LADLDNDELMKLLPPNTLTTDDANQIIMAARAHWFDDEEAPAEEEATDGEGEAAAESSGADGEA
jgi:N utilization substance protein A